MAPGSPSASSAAKLVYWSGADPVPSAGGALDMFAMEDAVAGDNEFRDGGADGRSMYVTLFEDMLKEVITGEGNLFTQEELNCFLAWHRLPYDAKYLFCRLCLRKMDKWHRFGVLRYESELGSEGILPAMERLCRSAQEEEDVKPKLEEVDIKFPSRLPSFQFELQEDIKPKLEPVEPTISMEEAKSPGPEVVDLTLDENEDEEQPKAGPSSPILDPPSSSTTPSQTPRIPDYSVFADDEEQAELSELLDCLLMHELEDIAKQLKLQPRSKKRDVIIRAILYGSATQTTLPFVTVSKKGKEPMVQTKLPFDAKKTQKSLMQSQLPFKPIPNVKCMQQERVRVIVMKKLKKCVRLNADVVALFRRANLVYFRSAQHTQELLVPAVLARSKKRTYAAYSSTRTVDIWPTREHLLAYEEALVIEAEVDALLDGSNGSGLRGRARSTASRTPGPIGGSNRLKTPITPAKGRVRHWGYDSPVKSRDDAKVADGEQEEQEQECERVKNARLVKEILQRVYPEWKALVSEKGEDGPRRKGLERFDCGHVLTRVVCKGAYALGILKEYREELDILEALLAQRRWRRGRRGRWYERRALVLMNHLKDEPGSCEEAMEVVVAALKDPDTHIVFRPMLERRLSRLEKRLKIPPEECHTCEGSLKATIGVFIEGVRIRNRESSLRLDQAGRVMNEMPSKTQGLSWSNRVEPSHKKVKVEPEKSTGKSIWKGCEDGEVTVEHYALQYYEHHGCKGFHCEGRIVTTLFGLLFWDILFAPVAGAFETPFQSAPLDLVEDTFYFSRRELADARLAAIEDGRAAEILDKAYDANKDVMCVGVRWDMFQKEELLGIVRCMQPSALMAMCRLMCEDYGARAAGVPDLIVWNEDEGYAKFVEVKGPGDTLQENQKLWIDVLLQAGMPVEVCHVYEKGNKPKTRGKGKTPKKAKASAGQKRKRDDWLVDSEDDEVDYSQLDMHDTEDEAELRASLMKKRRTHATLEILESPTGRKVARVSSQVEVVIASIPPSQDPSLSPKKKGRLWG